MAVHLIPISRQSILLKFSRARNLISSMLLDCENWRVEFGVEDVVKNFDFKELEVVNKY